MKFSGNMWLMIVLKVTRKQGFTISLEDTFFEKSQGRGGGGGQIEHPSSFLGLIVNIQIIGQIHKKIG